MPCTALHYQLAPRHPPKARQATPESKIQGLLARSQIIWADTYTHFPKSESSSFLSAPLDSYFILCVYYQNLNSQVEPLKFFTGDNLFGWPGVWDQGPLLRAYFTVPQKGYAKRGSKKRLLLSDLKVT